ncbi:MAG: YqcC family protein [Psychrobium sp.]|nr:YqcC family protein [Psychrobium sp.]
MSLASEVHELLDRINQEMINIDLWQSTLPSQEALASAEPFCCDTLSFSQWLEFILLPKMQMLIDSNMDLPSDFLILPMAQESFAKIDENTAKLLQLISQLDDVFSAHKS